MSAESTTQLIKKLGMKPGFSVIVFKEPDGYWDWLAPLPEKITVKSKGGLRFHSLVCEGE